MNYQQMLRKVQAIEAGRSPPEIMRDEVDARLRENGFDPNKVAHAFSSSQFGNLTTLSRADLESLKYVLENADTDETSAAEVAKTTMPDTYAAVEALML